MDIQHEWEREAQAEAEGGGPWTGHAGIDRRVLEMTRVIVEKIDRDRALVRVGLANIERWTRQKCHGVMSSGRRSSRRIDGRGSARYFSKNPTRGSGCEARTPSRDFSPKTSATRSTRDTALTSRACGASTRSVRASRGRPPRRWCSSDGGRRAGGPERDPNETRAPTEAAGGCETGRGGYRQAGRASGTYEDATSA